MFTSIRDLFNTVYDTVQRTLASRKAVATVVGVAAALRAGQVEVAAGLIVAFLAAEGYIDSKNV